MLDSLAEIVLEPLVALVMAIGKLLVALIGASARILIAGQAASWESLMQHGPLTFVVGFISLVCGVYVTIHFMKVQERERIPYPDMPFLDTGEEGQEDVLPDGGEDEDADDGEADDEEVAD